MTDEAIFPQEGSGVPQRIPPYISFATFLTFLGELKTNGFPPQIDGSVLRRFSGGVQSQLKMAIKSLGLVDGVKPTPLLAEMVEAYETPAFEPLLDAMLKSVYPYVFSLDLMTATPTMFAESFKVTGAKEDVARKCRTFFLHAAKRAGVPIGQRILSGSVPRGTTNGGVRKRPKMAKARDETQAEITTPAARAEHRPESDGYMDKLLEKFPKFDPEWPDNIKEKWFEGFDRFMKGAAK
jgi:hypothetical protein